MPRAATARPTAEIGTRRPFGSTSAVLTVAAAASLAALTAGCSHSTLLGGETSTQSAAPSTSAGPMATSEVFDRAFPVTLKGGEATLTLSTLRTFTMSSSRDPFVAVDVRALQASGQPVIDPSEFHAYDPGGHEFERVDDPSSVFATPLSQTTLQSPGQETHGSAGWSCWPATTSRR